MKEVIIALIGVVVGGAVTFLFRLRMAVWTENRQRRKERQGHIDALLSAIKDAVSVIEENSGLLGQEGKLREIPLLHHSDAWLYMIALGRADFLGDSTVGHLREVRFVLERADDCVRRISEAERELVNPSSSAQREGIARIRDLRKSLDRIYRDNGIVPRLQEAKQQLEKERVEQS
ncbi:MAG: hypothetical protein V1800_17625 [Candidatus Latescibacterota bacterium]